MKAVEKFVSFCNAIGGKVSEREDNSGQPDRHNTVECDAPSTKMILIHRGSREDFAGRDVPYHQVVVLGKKRGESMRTEAFSITGEIAEDR